MLSRGHIYINIPHPDKKHYIIQKSLFFNSLQEKKIRGGGGLKFAGIRPFFTGEQDLDMLKVYH